MSQLPLYGTRMAKSSSVLWSPFSSANRANPYPMYKRLRDTDPVHQTRSGDWLVSRYADVCTVLTDKRFNVIDMPDYFRNKVVSTGDAEVLMDSVYQATYYWLLYLNHTLHSRTREIVMKIWASLNFEQVVQSVIDEIAQEMRLKLQYNQGSDPSASPIDFIADMAKPLPVRIISRFIGFPEDKVEQLKEWGELLAMVFEPMLTQQQMMAINQAAADFLAFMETCVVDHEQQPRSTTLIGRLLTQPDSQGHLIDRRDLLSLVINLFVAGEETTRNLIGNGFYLLSIYPEQYERLLQQPELLKQAVEEMLRCDSPVQLTSRVATEDVLLAGKLIQAGQQVFVCPGSANYDEAQFEQAWVFDIGRVKNKHLSFGYGSHFCLGAQLARMQGMAAFRLLMTEFPRLRADTSRAVRRRNLLLRGFSSIPTYQV